MRGLSASLYARWQQCGVTKATICYQNRLLPHHPVCVVGKGR